MGVGISIVFLTYSTFDRLCLSLILHNSSSISLSLSFSLTWYQSKGNPRSCPRESSLCVSLPLFGNYPIPWWPPSQRRDPEGSATSSSAAIGPHRNPCPSAKLLGTRGSYLLHPQFSRDLRSSPMCYSPNWVPQILSLPQA